MDERLVFLLSCSWRSGSTLLQRYVTASGQVLVWGETGGALDKVASALEDWGRIIADAEEGYYGMRGGSGGRAYEKFRNAEQSDRPHQWIANLNPPFDRVENGIRNFLLDYYGKAAADLGYERIGVKETRCNLSTARSLRKLFPHAKFVFLVRDPLHVLKSIKRRNWIHRGSGFKALSYYVEHWRVRAKEFYDAEFGYKVRYEDFVKSEAERQRVLDYLCIEKSPPTDFVKNSRIDWYTEETTELTFIETLYAKYQLKSEMKLWGYR